MDEFNQQSHHSEQEQHFYENGSTKPPKSHKGLFAVILCFCIFVCGILTGMYSWHRELHPISKSESLFLPSGEFLQMGPSPSSSTAQITPSPEDQVQMELNPFPEKVDNIPQPGGLGLQEIYEKCIPSVVSITCTTKTGSGSGTGIVLSENGYVVTNAHVVEDAEQINVLLTDGRNLSAYLVGMDHWSDLAVLYIKASNLVPAEFGNSNQLRVGDAVVAIGDPLGVSLRGTMTDGIVSAINRDVESDGRVMTLIQTNAALNSGNSGGPLINCHGQVIGINTMKIGAFSDSAGVEGLGFAIPSVSVQEVVNQLIAQGYVSNRPTLPVKGEWVSLFDQQFRRYPAGLYITDPLEHPILRTGDIILQVDNQRVTTSNELTGILYSHKVGDTVSVTYDRNNQQFHVLITLIEEGK